MGLVKRWINDQWGRANSPATGGFFESPQQWLVNTAVSALGGSQQYGKIFGNPGAPGASGAIGVITEDIEGCWIGGNSEADCVQLYPQAGPGADNVHPISVSTKQPWVGFLRAPIYVFQSTPSLYNLNTRMHVEIDYVPSGEPLPTILNFARGPKRYYSGTLTLGAAVPFTIAIPCPGRTKGTFQFVNAGANPINTALLSTYIGFHDPTGANISDAMTDFVQLSTFGPINAATEAIQRVALQDDYVIVNLTSTLGTTARFWVVLQD